MPLAPNGPLPRHVAIPMGLFKISGKIEKKKQTFQTLFSQGCHVRWRIRPCTSFLLQLSFFSLDVLLFWCCVGGVVSSAAV